MFFNKKSLKFLAKNSGFKLVKIDYFGLDVMDYLAMKEGEDNYQYFKYLKEMVSITQAIIDKQNLSNSMRILFQKI